MGGPESSNHSNHSAILVTSSILRLCRDTVLSHPISLNSWMIKKGVLINNNGFLGGSDGKESACNAGDLGSIPGLGRSPRGGHGNPLQYSCLENPHGQKSLAGYTVQGVGKSQTRLSNSAHAHPPTHTHTHTHIRVTKDSNHSGNSKGFRSYVPRIETNQM